MSDSRHPRQPAPASDRARALESALRDKGLVPDGFLERFWHVSTEKWHPRNGARVVARAWVDPAYRARLLADGTAACAELNAQTIASRKNRNLMLRERLGILLSW